MIRHTVAFRLKHPPAAPAEGDFLRAAAALAAIEGVHNFECLRQTGRKNNFDFGLSMEFASAHDYQQYNEHPVHLRFVQTRWVNEVSDFLEIDYELL